MGFDCPKCHSSNLKRASLAYQEGLSRVAAQSRLRGLVFGDDGPNVVVGSDVTNGVIQTDLSKALRPPKKWSYGKLFLGAGLVLLVSLMVYIHFVMGSSSTVSGLPVVVFGVIGVGVLLLLLLSVWRHNLLVYPRQCAEWDRSFVCQRCGAVGDAGPSLQ